jgi:hypothetical protein
MLVNEKCGNLLWRFHTVTTSGHRAPTHGERFHGSGEFQTLP